MSSHIRTLPYNIDKEYCRKIWYLLENSALIITPYKNIRDICCSVILNLRCRPWIGVSSALNTDIVRRNTYNIPIQFSRLLWSKSTSSTIEVRSCEIRQHAIKMESKDFSPLTPVERTKQERDYSYSHNHQTDSINFGELSTIPSSPTEVLLKCLRQAYLIYPFNPSVYSHIDLSWLPLQATALNPSTASTYVHHHGQKTQSIKVRLHTSVVPLHSH